VSRVFNIKTFTIVTLADDKKYTVDVYKLQRWEMYVKVRNSEVIIGYCFIKVLVMCIISLSKI